MFEELKMGEEVDVYVAARVSNLPSSYVVSFKVPCSICGEDVWIDQNMEKYWSTMKIVCTACGLKLVSESEGQHTVEIVPENIKRIIEVLRSKRQR